MRTGLFHRCYEPDPAPDGGRNSDQNDAMTCSEARIALEEDGRAG
ncbi:hypothetical protein [Actinoplanes sp. GCM10030250]